MRVCGRDIRVQGRLIRIARLEADKYQFIDDPKPLIEGLRKSATRVDLFTFLQKLTDRAPKHPYPMEWDNFAVVPVTTFDNWWTKQIGFKARNKAKQAEKRGVTIGEVPFDDNLVRGICEIYNECPIRQGQPFSHYGMTFDRAREYSSSFLNDSIFIGASFEEKLIGFVKLTWDEGRTQANIMHIVSMVKHKDKAPTNALVVEAVRACADRGIPNLVYANFSYGKKQQDSLADFKERNGFQRIEIPRYYVPLTWLGAVGYRLGLHHRLLDIVPESLAAKYRAARRSFYTRKCQIESET